MCLSPRRRWDQHQEKAVSYQPVKAPRRKSCERHRTTGWCVSPTQLGRDGCQKRPGAVALLGPVASALNHGCGGQHASTQTKRSNRAVISGKTK